MSSSSGMPRRKVLRAAAVTAAVAPFVIVHELARQPTEKLPHVYAGERIRAETWNAIIDKVNAMSER